MRPADLRAVALALTFGTVLAGGWVWRTREPPAMPAQAPVVDELQQRFAEAVSLLNTGQFGPATTALHRVLQLAPAMPEAHVNLGYAMLGLGRPAMARQSFERAADLRPDQANAYHGLALALEAGGEIDLALGAMRTYLHLARNADEAHLRKARAALWEWEAKCGKAASGATAAGCRGGALVTR